MKHEGNKEQLILEAAEREFLERGYAGARTTVIAQNAGVTNAMLHYYFRTKEKLFQKVFHEKIQILAKSFEMAIAEKTLFQDAVRCYIEKHFDTLAEEPQILSFLYNEIVSNADSRNIVLEMMLPKFNNIISHFDKLMDEELAKGTVRPVKARDIFMNIVSLNMITFLALPALKGLIPNRDEEEYNSILKERKESIVQFVLNALRV